ncbi:Winged helix-turn-helix DNA-binding [Natronoarchaeum philippinense]|uniref:Winged helix-turn-helix DNA-binding n=1 Tax=Natronoarchaeum philippinense TaxID=558529 RepID=A0A285N9L7_NATPI|nr:winged helix-turn-helix domain-containing protein [Natronoarchaeum philippinense]SNZ06182.1 Winged helix-turn-helix DNA-binding [Natronoarchaeum philippinense]
MSVETPSQDIHRDAVVDCETCEYPQPRAHGAAVMNVLNDLAPSDRDRKPNSRNTLYARAIQFWRDQVGDHEQEPFVVAEDVEHDWLPATGAGVEYVYVLTSSRWKAGTGEGDDYSAFYDQHLKLRRMDDEGTLSKPSTSLHVEIMPQYRDLVYKDGNRLECPFGEGTKVRASTTWAESGDEIERRMYDAIRAVYGQDAIDVGRDRNDDARKIAKAEAHIRFAIEKKAQAIETIEQSKQLIGWGGHSEIEAHQRRLQEGWLEARVVSDRWDMLGFQGKRYDTGVKIYQTSDFAERSVDDPLRDPKLEASFAGVDDGALPHVDEWDSVLQHLREVVATHAQWAGIERADLTADDYFDGPAAPTMNFEKPQGRRNMLRRRYEDVATEIYKEALKTNTEAVYDILKVVAEESGASYDTLEERTGLARSTVRYHVARLAENGVFARLGNPVLVVFVSRQLLDRAKEIVREVYPDDQAEDMQERAEERRQRREERDDEARDHDGLDEPADSETDAPDRAGNDWEYFDLLDLEPHQIANAIERGYLEENHVRLRIDPYDWIDRGRS